jgi:hypothetical protein
MVPQIRPLPLPFTLEAVETIEEIETNANGSGSCDSSEVPIRVRNKNCLPSPKKQKTEIAFSDKELAVKFWLNEGGKKRLK